MNRLDSFFKDRLREHGTMPSSGAWEKVEARISKKNNKAIVLKIAAAIAAVGIATIVVLDQTTDNQTQVSGPQIVQQQPAQEPQKEAVQLPAVTDKNVTEKTVQSSKSNTQRTATKRDQEKNLELQATVTPAIDVIEKIEGELTTGVTHQEKPKSKRIVIVYSLPTIKSKNKDEAPQEDKKSGLQKVMDVAMDVRASDIPLGQLREAKDELFAFEFKKDKNKTKN